jgi:hypothetical protein
VSKDVWLPLATLILGYFGSLLTEYARDRRQSRRERESRLFAREEQRATFQRETILALQEVLTEVAKYIAEAYSQDREDYKQTGKWGFVHNDPETNERERLTRLKANMLIARVRDDTLRQLATEMMKASTPVALALSKEASDKGMDEMIDQLNKANERMGELLREL